MPVSPLLLELLEKAAESGLSAEEVCRDQPHLIAEVRACLRQLSSVKDEMDALFPEEDEPAPARSAKPEISGYSVGDVIGRGGMGVVYRAIQLGLKRSVAVKMMLNGGFAGPAELVRFRQEAEALAVLQHPNIVQVHDVGESSGLPYFAMELVEGGSLAQRLGGVPQPAQDAASLMLSLADAVEAAHRGGIVHRDLKPSNVLMTAGGVPKITDFGLARRLEAGLSITAMRIGTPGYMAPEQVEGHARVSGVATDVYSLGAILYEMLTGRPPFRAETAAETERQVVAEEPATPSRLNARVPHDLETICLKCLQKDPRRRYSSAQQLGEDVGRYLRGEPIQARPVSVVERGRKWVKRHPARAVMLFGGMAIAVALGVGGWWSLSAQALTIHAIEEDLRTATQALRRSNWGEARSALERARWRHGLGGSIELGRRLDAAGRNLELTGRLAAIRIERLSQTKWGGPDSCGEYETAFREAGLLTPNERARLAADRIAASDVKDALVAAIDDWALCAGYVADSHREAWLLEVARKADPDPVGWRDRLRDPTVRKDKQELSRLANSAALPEAPVNLLVSLGELLQKCGGNAEQFLLSVQRHHPDDLGVNYLLGTNALNRNDLPEALRNFQAALAARPEASYLSEIVGETLFRAGKRQESLAYYARAVHLDPKAPIVRFNYGHCLMETGQFEAAAEQFERGLSLARDDQARTHLRSALRRSRLQLGQMDRVESMFREMTEGGWPDHADWDGYAELCLYRGRPEDYRAVCGQLIARFGATEDAQIAERTGRACLLAPVSGKELEAATALIDRALADKNPKPGWIQPYFMVAKGLAEYRHGRLESAISIMDGPASSALQPAPRLVTAMALFRIGRKEEAHKTLAEAIRSGDWDPAHAKDREKWIYHILRREAEAMILPDLSGFMKGK